MKSPALLPAALLAAWTALAPLCAPAPAGAAAPESPAAGLLELLIAALGGEGAPPVVLHDFAAVVLQPARGGASWQGLEGELSLPEDSPLPFDGPLPFTCREVAFSVGGLPRLPFLLDVAGCEVVVQSAVEAPFRPAIEITSVYLASFGATLREGLGSFSLQEGFANLRACLRGLASRGLCPMETSFAGTIRFRIDGESAEVKWRSRSAGGSTSLELDGGDVASAAAALRISQPLTEAETGLLARHPLEAPRLLVLRDRAARTSRSARREDRSVPEDAYRHVLWSYLLARAYGPAFAREVTNAHEEGRTGNTPAERRMDYHNNRVGERYAAEGVDEGRILEFVRSDPAVVRRPEDAPLP